MVRKGLKKQMSDKKKSPEISMEDFMLNFYFVLVEHYRDGDFFQFFQFKTLSYKFHTFKNKQELQNDIESHTSYQTA